MGTLVYEDLFLYKKPYRKGEETVLFLASPFPLFLNTASSNIWGTYTV